MPGYVSFAHIYHTFTAEHASLSHQGAVLASPDRQFQLRIANADSRVTSGGQPSGRAETGGGQHKTVGRDGGAANQSRAERTAPIRLSDGAVQRAADRRFSPPARPATGSGFSIGDCRHGHIY